MGLHLVFRCSYPGGCPVVYSVSLKRAELRDRKQEHEVKLRELLPVITKIGKRTLGEDFIKTCDTTLDIYVARPRTDSQISAHKDFIAQVEALQAA